jgi:cytokinesis protein
MVQLIQIDRLGPRIEGMLYKCAFEESWSLLDDVSRHSELDVLGFTITIQGARKLSDAGQSLLQAKHFKELLSVSILQSLK